MTTTPSSPTTPVETTTPATSDAGANIGAGILRHARTLRQRLLVAGPLTVLVVALSMVPALHVPHWQWIVALASLPVVTWAAWPFHRAAAAAGRHGSTTMDTLVSLGVLASTLWSWWALLLGGAADADPMGGAGMDMTGPASAPGLYFEGACVIVTFLLIGRLIEARTRHSAGDALRSLLHMGATTATRLVITEDGTRTEERVPASDLRVGDLFLVRPGDTVATDGVVVDGSSALDTSLLTGESLPVDVSVGDSVTGATLNTWGSLTVRATRVGSDTTLARIGKALTEAQAAKAPVQRLADRISGVFVPVVLVIAALTLVGHLLVGSGAQAALTAAVAVLVVACPCALGLATPTALLVGSGRASQLGILIRTPEILEETRAIDTIVLDKTGTLTTGRMSLDAVHLAAQAEDGAASPTHSHDEAPTLTHYDALALAAGVESASEHPVARAVTRAAEAAGLTPATTRDFTNHAGLGVSALDGDTLVLVGRPTWLADLGLPLDPTLAAATREAEESGATVVALATVPHWSDRPTPRAAAADGHAPAHPSSGEDTGASFADATAIARIDMAVDGMTCASCVRRVERKLGKLDGVDAVVNLATESATITLTREWSDADLEAVVDAAGYHGTVRGREDLTAPPATSSAPEAEAATGARVLPSRLDGAVRAVLVVRDTVKDTSADAVRQFHDLGITPVLVTGDNEAAARHVADQLGITEVHARTLPDDKQRLVARFQDEGRTVAVVGDGVNDAAALAQAGQRGLGMAMGSGTDVARDVADITLVSSDPASAAAAIRISRRMLRTIKENLFWAFVYNVAMIPLAVAGALSPMIAAAAMAFSSVFVVGNSLRLRRAR